jgi:hypothetical protein
MAQDTDRDVRARLLALLLEKVDEDLYPSSTMLDMIEELITQADVSTYADVLMRKIDDDVYPSISIMRRVLALS